MSDYISTEIEKIIHDKKLEPPQNFVMSAAWIMGNLKGMNLKIIDVRNVSPITDYYIIGSASNIVQASAMADTIAANFKNFGEVCKNKEGKDKSDWVLLDFGNYIVHIFLETARYAYDLDSLWGKCPIVPIPQDYYFSGPEGSSSKSDKGYF